MNTEQISDSQTNADVPPGYAPREVVWPGTEERIMALFPVEAADAN